MGGKTCVIPEIQNYLKGQWRRFSAWYCHITFTERQRFDVGLPALQNCRSKGLQGPCKLLAYSVSTGLCDSIGRLFGKLHHLKRINWQEKILKVSLYLLLRVCLDMSLVSDIHYFSYRLTCCIFLNESFSPLFYALLNTKTQFWG